MKTHTIITNERNNDMKKEEIVKAIIKNVKRQDGQRFKKEEVQDIINYAIELTKQSLRERDRVIFRGFGSFVVRHYKPRKMFDIKTRDLVMTDGRDAVAFVPSTEFDINSML